MADKTVPRRVESAGAIDRHTVVHAVPGDDRHANALCGYRPSYNMPGWSLEPAVAVTCARCRGEFELAEGADPHVRQGHG